MTSEDDFQRMLDANPEDHATRLVFADWLQDRDDARTEGYRALGVLRRYCEADEYGNRWTHWGKTLRMSGWLELGSHSCLPGDWHEHLFSPAYIVTYWSREHADDAAAVAFSLLSCERRAELLAGKAVAA